MNRCSLVQFSPYTRVVNINDTRLFRVSPSWRQCWGCSAFHLSRFSASDKMIWRHWCSSCPPWLAPSSHIPSSSRPFCLALGELSPRGPVLSGPSPSPKPSCLAPCALLHHSLSLPPLLSAPSPVASPPPLPLWALLWPWHVCFPVEPPRVLRH